MITSSQSESALKMCEHCKRIWIKEPKQCNCGRKFFVPTHIRNLPYAEDRSTIRRKGKKIKTN